MTNPKIATEAIALSRRNANLTRLIKKEQGLDPDLLHLAQCATLAIMEINSRLTNNPSLIERALEERKWD